MKRYFEGLGKALGNVAEEVATVLEDVAEKVATSLDTAAENFNKGLDRTVEELQKEGYFPPQKKEDVVAVRESLYDFVQNLYWGDNLTVEESNKNLENGLIEIRRTGFHSCNGILLTDDGYFLTAKHCVDHAQTFCYVRTSDGRSYELEKVCATELVLDLALAKADIPGRPRARTYRLSNTGVLQEGTPVALLTRRSGEINSHYGFVSKTQFSGKQRSRRKRVDYPIVDNFCIAAPSRPGDSGGIVVSNDGRLVGIISSSDTCTTNATKIIDGLELVSSYRNRLLQQ